MTRIESFKKYVKNYDPEDKAIYFKNIQIGCTVITDVASFAILPKQKYRVVWKNSNTAERDIMKYTCIYYDEVLQIVGPEPEKPFKKLEWI